MRRRFAAQFNGVESASHIKSKLIEMIHLNETLYSCGLACSTEGKPTAAGNFIIDLLLANVCKQNVTRFPYEIARLAEDIAGGLMVTMPSERDLKTPELRSYIEKYLRGANGVCAEDRMRVLRLIENITLGTGRRRLPHRIHARSGFARSAADHDRAPERHRRKKRFRQKARRNKRLTGIADRP